MKVTVTFEVSDETARLVTDNSLVRVINTSIRVIDNIEGETEDADTNLQDWEFCKPIASSLWNALRDGIFRAKLKENQARDWPV